MRNVSWAGALILVAIPGIVSAAELGDAQQGLVYANQVCARCHAVEPGGQVSANSLAPSFNAVADTPGLTARALVVWMQSSDHAMMPNLMLKPADLDDVVAYIMSLRAPK